MAEVKCNPRDHELILVTGATGFVGSQIVHLLLRSGYRVRCAVRCITNEKKVRPILNLCPDSTYPVELVEADLNNHDSWDRAVRGCRYVLAVACPVPSEEPEDEKEIINPAVNGTLSILQASHKHRVKRVVLTSSIVAICGDYSARDPPGKVYTEEDWTDVELVQDAYIKAKTLAEKAAWKFLAELPEKERFELAVINPTSIFGPILCGELNVTGKMLKKLLARETPLLPRLNMPVVDVRDVALAHMQAMLLPQAAGKRTIVHSGTGMWFEDVAKTLAAEFDPQGYNVPTKLCPNFLLKAMALTDSTFKFAMDLNDKVQIYDNSRMKSVLKIKPRDAHQTFIDMAYSLIEGGFVKKENKYHGPPSETNSVSRAQLKDATRKPSTGK
jgi:nucleoside-diphosphate-sugar epimerase